jgi:NADPH-dependent curcumin reductase CurA
MPLVTTKRLQLRGILVTDPDMGPKYGEEHQRNVQKWIKNKEIVVKVDVTEGMDNAAQGIVGLLQGKNFGKAVLKVADI